MRIAIGSDEIGFSLKSRVIAALESEGHVVLDLGSFSTEPVDYPDYARVVAQAVLRGFVDTGVLLCASGVGASIAANKLRGVRAAFCPDSATATQSREQENANVLCLSASTLDAKMMLELCRHPELYRRARAEVFRVYGTDGPITYQSLRELPFVECAVKETLRLHTPLFMLLRVAMKDFEYDGYVMKKGTNLVVSPTVTHRIPEVFKDPDRFDPDRFAPGREEDKRKYAFQAFGGGAHKCLGNAFAILQIKSIFALLLRRFEFSAYGDPLAPDFHGVVLGPKQPCRVRYRRIDAAQAEELARNARGTGSQATASAAGDGAARCPFTGKA